MTVEVGNYLNVHRQALGKYLNADTGVDHREHVPLAHLAELHRGELATALAEARAVAAEAEARHRGELAEVEASAAGAKELAEARLAEIGRLVAQIPATGSAQPRG